MQLQPRDILGSYEILGLLGAGGMGEVYKARDRRLNRLVAIKVLPASRMQNPDWKRQFLGEGRTASALNHPNIVIIHEIESWNGTDFLVMEYVPGKSLDVLIPRTGMRIGEVLRIAVQVSGALAKAHAVGVIHRDLKPSNIMVADDGTAKILDFGIAKLFEKSGTSQNDETVTALPVTSDRTIAGTPAYMAPEQAQGAKLDARADVFSFGVVLYEMLTGRRAFTGESTATTLASVIRDDPEPLRTLRREIPDELERIVRRCLRKDAGKRFQTMGDMKVALEEIAEDLDSGVLTTPERAPRSRRMLFAAVVLTCAVLLVAAVVWYKMAPDATAPEVLQITPLTTLAGAEFGASFSPDANQIVFSWRHADPGQSGLFVKLVEGGPSPMRLTTEAEANVIASWSPDGRHIAFYRIAQRRGAVYLISPLGPPERKLAETAETEPYFDRWRSLAWSADSKLVAYSDRAPGETTFSIFTVDITNRERKRLTFPPSGSHGDFDIAFSPNGRYIAFTRVPKPTVSDLYVASSSGGQARRITKDEVMTAGVAWTHDSQELIFASARSGGGLWRINVHKPEEKPKRLTADGEYPVLSKAHDNGRSRLIFERTYTDINIISLLAIDDPGQKAQSVIASTRFDSSPQLSPDGGRIAFNSNRSGSYEIWVAQRDGSNPVQLTSFGLPHVGAPRWSPDGSQISFDSAAEGNRDVYLIAADGGSPRRLTSDSAEDSRPSWSGDGQTIYYRSDRSGSQQIWRMPKDGGAATQLTRAGGFESIESADGARLYYTRARDLPGLWSIPVHGGAETAVLDSVWSGAWDINRLGIYFLGRPAEISRFEPGTGRVMRIATLPKDAGRGAPSFSVSRDGRWTAFAQTDQANRDLMLIERFE